MTILPASAFATRARPAILRATDPMIPNPSNQNRRRALGTLGVVAAGVVLGPEELFAAPAPVWKPITVNDRDYISSDDIKAFYRFESVKKSGRKTVFRSPTLVLEVYSGSQEMLINQVKFILSYPTITQGGKLFISRLDLSKLIDPVLRPTSIAVPEPFDTVVIDPGHGKQDSGGRSVYGHEKEYALDTGLQMRQELMKRNFKVKMTRSTDTYPSLGARVNLANSIPNSIFISVHYNSGPRSADGLETFALSPQGTASTYDELKQSDGSKYGGNNRDAENIALATAVHASMIFTTRKLFPGAVTDRGLKRARFKVLRGLTNPSVLIEGGFLSNPKEARRIASPKYRKAIAIAVAQGAQNYRDAVLRRRKKK